MRNLVTFICGLMFGLGLVISGMTDPSKVIGFLDVTGDFDPSLALVMAAALAVAFPGFRLATARLRPVLAETFSLPTKTMIDRPLILGASVFGAGWGMSGLCPGPAIAAAAYLDPVVSMALGGMLAGMVLHDVVVAPRRRSGTA